MKLLLACTLTFSLASLATAAPVPKEAPKELKDLIQGEWKMTEFVREGQPRPDKAEGAKVTFKGDEIIISDGNRDEVAKFKIDTKATPMSIDIQPTRNGKVDEKLVKGLIKFEKEKITICFSVDGEERPKEFKSEEKSKTGMFTLERVKK